MPNDPLRSAARKRKSLRPLAVDASRLATLLSLGLRTIRTMDAAGKLPTPFRCGNRKLWSVTEIKAWIAADAPDRAEWEQRKKSTR
jgi:predicted DNA-binding transcriptional regulator AlpA